MSLEEQIDEQRKQINTDINKSIQYDDGFMFNQVNPSTAKP